MIPNSVAELIVGSIVGAGIYVSAKKYLSNNRHDTLKVIIISVIFGTASAFVIEVISRYPP